MNKYLPTVSHVFVLLLLFSTTAASATTQSSLRDRVISGRVVSAKTNEGIAGVTVLQKGTSNGTISDADGNYTLTVSDSSVLVFSFIGFVKQEVRVGAENVINISMEEDVKMLEEVVAVGYGEQKRSDLSGAMSVVKTGDMQNKTQLRMDQALQGLAAGAPRM